VSVASTTSVTSPVRNSGIRLASDAFRTSRRVESGERLFPLGYFSPVFLSVKAGKSWSTITWRGRLPSLFSNRLHVTVPRPVDCALQEPSSPLQYMLVEWRSGYTLILLSCHKVRPTCDLRLVRHVKDESYDLTYCRLFVDQDYTAVYIDGPLFHGSSTKTRYFPVAFTVRHRPQQCHLPCTQSLSALLTPLPHTRSGNSVPGLRRL
jgi:hypothetical protein